MSNELVAVDIGGTNARFCRVTLTTDRLPELATIRKYKVADYSGLADAWEQFVLDEGKSLPDRATIALAAPMGPGPIKLTNSHWVIDAASLKQKLNLPHLTLINDFEAMAYGVSALPQTELNYLFGPDHGLPDAGVVTVVGPGTGLGVGIISLSPQGTRIFATEGGHIDFAPVDKMDDRLLQQLRGLFSRVSVERLVSGPGLNTVFQALGAVEGVEVPPLGDSALWQQALSNDGALPQRALERLCMSYGSVAGDLALAHGATAVVLVGGLTEKMKDHPAFRHFHSRFCAKGRYRDRMDALPVYHASHVELGLFGAAVAGQLLSV